LIARNVTNVLCRLIFRVGAGCSKGILPGPLEPSCGFWQPRVEVRS
jgi:hypothetical protein